jgi:hypothetical protein
MMRVPELTLLDYFAAQLLSGLVNYRLDIFGLSTHERRKELHEQECRFAYELATQMMSMRENYMKNDEEDE